MNVLILHNRYRAAGGEERSVAEIVKLLRARGHAVTVCERRSADLGRARAAIGMLRGGLDPDPVAELVRRERIDVVHAHNINPAFGPRTLEAAREAGARVVMHLHNYRLVCAVATAYRDSAVCTECQATRTRPGFTHRCRGGLAESAVYARGIALAQPRILAAVDRFVVPSAAAVERLASLGLPTDRMTVLHNFLTDERFASAAGTADAGPTLFAGRLVEEKGAELAIAACARARVPLVVAGEGPQAQALRAMAQRIGSEVRFTGHVNEQSLTLLRAAAGVALMPSNWDEPCPYSLIEAMAAGLPPLVSDVGGLPEMAGIENALPARAVETWSERLRAVYGDATARRQAAEAALDRARDLFSADRFYKGLMEVYGARGQA